MAALLAFVHCILSLPPFLLPPPPLSSAKHRYTLSHSSNITHKNRHMYFDFTHPLSPPPFHLFPRSLFLHGKFIWLLSRPGSCNGRQTVATPTQKLRHRETHKHERFQHGHKRGAVSLTGVVDVGDSLDFLRSVEGKEKPRNFLNLSIQNFALNGRFTCATKTA
jgi:hypothetical protein